MPNGFESDVLLHNDLLVMNRGFCRRNIPQVLLFDKFCGAKNDGNKTVWFVLINMYLIEILGLG